MQRPCVYLDTGEGWTEAGRIELQPEGTGRWGAMASVGNVVGPLRFDPSEQAGRFRLGRFELESLEPGALLLELLARDAKTFPDSAVDVLTQGVALARLEGPAAASGWLLGGGADSLRQPPGSYAEWIGLHDSLSPEAMAALRGVVGAMPVRPLFSLLLPVSGERHDLVQACVASLLAQCYPDWELLLACDDEALTRPMRAAVETAVAASTRIRRIQGAADGAGTWNQALDVAAGGWFGVIEGAPVFAPHALMAFAQAVTGKPDAGMVYSDCDRLDGAGRRHSPGFRPAWNPDLFLSHDYVADTALFDIGLLREAGGFRADHAPALAADLALRSLAGSDRGPVHVPMVLSHWPDAGSGLDPEAVAEARRSALREHLAERVLAIEPAGRGAHVRWPLPAQPPRVSLIVPTRDRVDLLRRCIESVLSLTTYPDFEVLVVDNGSVEVDTLEYLASLESRPGVRVLRYAHPFNYSAINNFAAGEAGGDILALVNNDIEVLSPDWLDEMTAHALRPGIGAVGAMLYYPDDSIQHAGVVVGLGGVAGHVYSRQPRGSTGLESRAALAQNMSAVTAACLVVSKAAWLEVGGLDEDLMVAFNDIDFCLRLRQAGYRNLWTPHAEFYHHESASRGSEDTEEKRQRFHSEVMFMIDRWGPVLEDDPAYNPNLSLRHGAANELASPPRRGLQHWLARMEVTTLVNGDIDRPWKTQ
ncbi:glycosyltransferase family 2 protein [Luteimonas changyuni]|uniref:glycosyltransferase family 2 protein n=1 Tax=Luteimonas sp. MJ145 TaxID=3129234 RepID=UPI0031BB099B